MWADIYVVCDVCVDSHGNNRKLFRGGDWPRGTGEDLRCRSDE